MHTGVPLSLSRTGGTPDSKMWVPGETNRCNIALLSVGGIGCIAASLHASIIIPAEAKDNEQGGALHSERAPQVEVSERL